MACYSKAQLETVKAPHRKQPMAVQMLRTHLTVISLLNRGWLQPGAHQLSLQHLHMIGQIAVLANLFLQTSLKLQADLQF